MPRDELLDRIIAGNGGIIRTSDVLNAGVSKPQFYQYVRDRSLRQVLHGAYAAPDAWVDGIYLLHVRCAQAVFSHESALFFHDMTDREPPRFTVTVRTGYNPTRLNADGVKVYTVKSELHSLGICEMTTQFGHTVPVYDPERTICDIIRSRSGIEIQTFQDALRGYARREDKDLRKLMRYAAAFHVETMLSQYLEVLL